MTRTTLILLTLILSVLVSCSGQPISWDTEPCDVKLRFGLDRNSSLQFYDSTGTLSWKWDNDSLDFIYSYFHVSAATGDRVKIDSVMILSGFNENGGYIWEPFFLEKDKTQKKLKGSWIDLSQCETELGEWMLIGNYEDPYTPYIFESPDSKSAKTQFDPREGFNGHEIRVLAVRGTWLKVKLTLENNSQIGWMPSYFLCANPHTTCN